MVELAGGFSSDTLAEDQVALKLQRLGYKVSYAENAIAWTEAPPASALASSAPLVYGTLQCMWKHRGALLRRRAGLWARSPCQAWVFQICFVDLTFDGFDAGMDWFRLGWNDWNTAECVTPIFYRCPYITLFLAVDGLAAAFRPCWRTRAVGISGGYFCSGLLRR